MAELRKVLKVRKPGTNLAIFEVKPRKHVKNWYKPPILCTRFWKILMVSVKSKNFCQKLFIFCHFVPVFLILLYAWKKRGTMLVILKKFFEKFLTFDRSSFQSLKTWYKVEERVWMKNGLFVTSSQIIR